MSLATQIEGDVEGVFLNTDDFAQTVVRYPLAVTGSPESVIAVFAEKDASQETTRGDENERTATLHVAASVDADPRDTWLINSEVWQVTAVKGGGDEMQVIELRKREKLRIRPTGVR